MYLSGEIREDARSKLLNGSWTVKVFVVRGRRICSPLRLTPSVSRKGLK